MKRYLYFSDINQIADINLKNYIFENIDKDIKIDFLTSFGSTRNFNKKSIANYKNIKWINIFQKILIKLNLYKIDQNYRGLIIGSLKNNKVNYIHDYLDIKKLLVKKFKKNSKKVIQVFDSSCFDFNVDLNADKYLIPSKFIRDNYIPKRLHKKCIFTGIIFNQCRIDDLLNKKEFFFKI